MSLSVCSTDRHRPDADAARPVGAIRGGYMANHRFNWTGLTLFINERPYARLVRQGLGDRFTVMIGGMESDEMIGADARAHAERTARAVFEDRPDIDKRGRTGSFRYGYSRHV